MKKMDKERCHWCEWENVTSGGCMRTEPGTGYEGKTEELGGKCCPGFEKWSMNQYARRHRRFLEEEGTFEFETLWLNGELEERLMMVGKRARCWLDDMVKAELKEHPAPESDNILEVAGYIQNVKDSLEEIVLKVLVYKHMPFGGTCKLKYEE